MTDAREAIDILRPAKGFIGYEAVYDCDCTERIVEEVIASKDAEIERLNGLIDAQSKNIDQRDRQIEQLQARLEKCLPYLKQLRQSYKPTTASGDFSMIQEISELDGLIDAILNVLIDAINKPINHPGG